MVTVKFGDCGGDGPEGGFGWRVCGAGEYFSEGAGKRRRIQSLEDGRSGFVIILLAAFRGVCSGCRADEVTELSLFFERRGWVSIMAKLPLP